ncbi:hypothetical protein XENOCAPTIV_017918 [Xenoophorus captivus]|uniref:Uncharacterized protein n=1 Tax=Xenoophorus captivus TaxID=1517983 RepID=A0ABV0RB75_9TELE
MEVSQTISTSCTSSGSFPPPSKVTFHVPTANLSVLGSGLQGLCLRPLPDPLCTGSSGFLLQVVHPLLCISGSGLAWPGPVRSNPATRHLPTSHNLSLFCHCRVNHGVVFLPTVFY